MVLTKHRRTKVSAAGDAPPPPSRSLLPDSSVSPPSCPDNGEQRRARTRQDKTHPPPGSPVDQPLGPGTGQTFDSRPRQGRQVLVKTKNKMMSSTITPYRTILSTMNQFIENSNPTVCNKVRQGLIRSAGGRIVFYPHQEGTFGSSQSNRAIYHAGKHMV